MINPSPQSLRYLSQIYYVVSNRCNVSSGDFQVRWSRTDRQPLGNNFYQIGNELIITSVST